MVVFLLFVYYVLIKPKKLKKTYVYSYSRYFNGPSNKIIFVRPKKKNAIIEEDEKDPTICCPIRMGIGIPGGQFRNPPSPGRSTFRISAARGLHPGLIDPLSGLRVVQFLVCASASFKPGNPEFQPGGSTHRPVGAVFQPTNKGSVFFRPARSTFRPGRVTKKCIFVFLFA